jgi:hypothetical protein
MTARAERILLVPGAGNSGPDHWHTHWQATDRTIQRVKQADWNDGTRAQWIEALDRDVRASSASVVLAAHSMGAVLVAHWAAAHRGPIAGALLVAPADVEGNWAGEGSLYRRFAPIPMMRLPFASIVVASTNDPYLSISRAQELAQAWGSRLHVVGALGHVGSDAKLGNWEPGLKLLDGLREIRAGD